MKTALIVLLLLLFAVQIYVRFAPTDPARWNTVPDVPGDAPRDIPDEGAFTAVRHIDAPPADVLSRIDAIARDTPRTARVAGTPDADTGPVTYRTRSALWGFPDYTTVSAVPADGGTRLTIHARLRFGRADFGVNRARVEDWLARL